MLNVCVNAPFFDKVPENASVHGQGVATIGLVSELFEHAPIARMAMREQQPAIGESMHEAFLG